MTKLLDTASGYCRDKNMSKCPLYEQVVNYMAHPVKSIPQSLQDQRRAILKIFDEIRAKNNRKYNRFSI